jgi:large subunit ribosomal protein L16
MGKGKGSVETWVAEVKSGKIMYEITGIAEKLAVEALELAAAKLPIKTKVVIRSSNLI